MSPLHDRYNRIRAALPPTTLLLVRLGDFYEAYDDCAKTIADCLTLVITKRNEAPMCGIPYHARKTYFDQLVSQGKSIAIYEEYPEPKNRDIFSR